MNQHLAAGPLPLFNPPSAALASRLFSPCLDHLHVYPASRSERAAEYCDKLACLFVCPLARLRNHKSKLQNISTDVTCGLRPIEARTSSDGIAICCVLWVVWTTSCLLIIGQTKAMHVQGLQCSKWLTNGQQRNGAESAVYDCLFSPEPKIVSFDMHNRHFGIESVT